MESELKKSWYWLWIGIAVFHLTIVGLGAASVNLSGLGPLGVVLDHYGSITGAGDSYGFFAPGVFRQIRARFDVVDAKGRRTPAALESGANHEADLRVGNIIDQFQNDSDDPQAMQRSIAASLAGTLFGRHPKTKTVVVRLEEFVAVSMSDYRHGVRPKWSSLYEATFEHNARGVAE